MKNFWLDQLKLWEIYDGERHWYVSSSEEDALKQHSKEFDIEALFSERIKYLEEEVSRIKKEKSNI